MHPSLHHHYSTLYIYRSLVLVVVGRGAMRWRRRRRRRGMTWTGRAGRHGRAPTARPATAPLMRPSTPGRLHSPPSHPHTLTPSRLSPPSPQTAGDLARLVTPSHPHTLTTLPTLTPSQELQRWTRRGGRGLQRDTLLPPHLRSLDSARQRQATNRKGSFGV